MIIPLWLCQLALAALAAAQAFTNSTKPSVTFTTRSFLIDGVPRILRGGTIQWFRLPPETWEDRIIKFKAMGFNTVDAYVGWRNHEPVEGQWDWSTYDLKRFLELCKKHEMWVYLRPGPYITNEMDSGGLPQWLFTRTTKKVRDPDNNDGLINLRTNDKDWLDLVRRYFAELAKQIRPYLYTGNRGPIILMAIENEFTWGEIFFEVDKFAILPDGTPERPGDQIIDTKGYLTQLRLALTDNGIDVPVATGPGDGKVSGLGDARDIIPMPSVYRNVPGLYTVPFTAVELLNDMHNPANHEGAYVNMPSGITECTRDPYVLRASIFAGLDAIFQFNIAASHQEDYQNTLLLNSGDVANYDQAVGLARKFLDAGRSGAGFLRPQVGFFGSVIDYFAAISPSGLLREKFHQIRRFNLFVNDFEELIGAVGDAKRTVFREKSSGWFGIGKKDDYVNMDTRVVIMDKRVGSEDPDVRGERANYWLEVLPNSAFITLYNDGVSKAGIDMCRDSISAFNMTFPRFSTFTVPVEVSSSEQEQGSHLRYSQVLPVNIPLPSGNLTIQYSTSEILTARQWGKPTDARSLLVVYGTRNTQGELALVPTALSRDATLTVRAVDAPAVEIRNDSSAAVTLVYTYTAKPLRLVAELVPHPGAPARLTDIVIVDTYLAGKCWFPGSVTNSGVSRRRLATTMVCGPDFVDETATDVASAFAAGPASTLPSLMAGSADVFTIAPAAAPAPVATTQFRAVPASLLLKSTDAAPAIELPSLRANTKAFAYSEDLTIDNWEPLGDAPVALETKNYATGITWYRAEANLSREDLEAYGIVKRTSGNLFSGLFGPKDPTLYVPFAADVVGVYLNGRHVTTLNPIGTEIDNDSSDPLYRFTLPREFFHTDPTRPQVLTFRVEVWGHGSFMWFRGRLQRIAVPGTNLSIPLPFFRGGLPSLGFDAVKGITGTDADLCGRPLRAWALRKGSQGEALGLPAARDPASVPSLGNRGWEATSVPFTLKPGEIRWVRWDLDPAALPDPDAWTAALNLRLEGCNTMATVWINGRLVGRWISDEGWLNRGNWAKTIRGPWSVGDEDEIPVQVATLPRDRRSVVMIRFVDCGTFENPGSVNAVDVVVSKNEERFVRANGEGVALSTSLFKTTLNLF
ncbi:hypothetical protein HDU96_007222 [Phlyctochytrium bullatum]|nr:hypothetical protein HDU96_007222 [Phlyctochytrium bullatum]